MNAVNIGLFGNSAELLGKVASALGKKGTQSDITLYDTKSPNLIVTAVLPHSYPEKLQSLFFTINLCDIPILVADKVDPVLGEVIVALDEAGFEKGFLLTSAQYITEQLKPLLKGTKLEKYTVFENADDSVINELRIKAFETVVERKSGKTHVIVDHSFNVKGVGTVVLGVVYGGQIKVYDKLRVVPGKKETTIKSIQKHDDNFQTAEPGDRVGLCLKDVTVEDVSRGTILSNSAIETKKAEIKLSVSRFYKLPIKTGQTLYLSAGMQYLPFKVEVGDVESGETNIIVADFEKSIAFVPGQKVFVLNPNMKTLRIAGSGFIESAGN